MQKIVEKGAMQKVIKEETKTDDDFPARPPKIVRGKIARFSMKPIIDVRLISYGKATKRKNLRIVSTGNGIISRNTCGIKPMVQNLSIIAKQINHFAFYNWRNLVKVFLDQVEYIGDYAFGSCKCLKFIYVSDTLKRIGSNIFAHCDSLVIIYSGTTKDWESINKHPDWSNNCNSLVVRCSDGNVEIKSL